MDSVKSGRAMARVARWVVLATLLFSLAATLTPDMTPSASATTCPEGYVLGPDQEIVNSDGTVTRIPGDCIPAPELNLDGNIQLNLPEGSADQSPAGGIGTPIAGDASGLDPGLVLNIEPAYVTVHAYNCEGEVDWASQTLEALRNQCLALPGAGFAFASYDGNGAQTAQGGGQTDADGLAFWTVEFPGPVSISESAPQGMAEPVVYCGLATGLGNLSLAPVAGATTSLTVQPGQQFYCDWFTVSSTGAASEELGSLTILKLVCPPMNVADPETMLQALSGQVQNLGPRKTSDTDPVSEMLCTEFEVTIGEGFTFDVALDGQDLGSKTTDASGRTSWTDIPPGTLVVTEQIPDGYGIPFFYCHSGRAPYVADFVASATIPIIGAAEVECVVVNVPDGYGDGGVVVFKWECEEDPGYQTNMPEYLESLDCKPVDNIQFSVTDGTGSTVAKSTGAGFIGGQAAWTEVPPGSITISESLPAGYGQPVIYCTSELPSASPYQLQAVSQFSGAVLSTELEPGEILVCHWINLPEHDSSVVVYKYTCPEGYDPGAGYADPEYDCTVLTNDVAFTLYGDNIAQEEITGSYGDGAAMWADLPAGEYSIVETPPAGTAAAFVLRCEGNIAQLIQNVPLATGYELYLQTAPGDHVVCFWYNIPEPDWGTVTVIKYACPQSHFVSPDNCQIWESGVEFELLHYVGSGSVVAGSGTTNSAGYLTWTGLQDGAYELVEVGREWCYAESSRTDSSGNIEVLAGKETTVWVYNCGVKVPVKTPVKYPNTGVGAPDAAAAGSMAPVSKEGAYRALPHNRWAGVLDGRIAASFSGGDRPVRIEIESIGLQADIEVLEIVDGAFQDPTTSDKAAWYKETALPGSNGNMVLAGHLNYWGDPEGVFFALDQVESGDIIEVTAQDGVVHHYEVTSVGEVDATAETLTEVVARTDSPTLTLITCGGEWDAANQTYLQRTVVRAVSIDIA